MNALTLLRSNNADSSMVTYRVGSGDILAAIAMWAMRPAVGPGVQIIHTAAETMLLAVATPAMYISIDGVRLCHVRADVWTDGWGNPVLQYPGGGVLVAALRPRDGMLVRAGSRYCIVLNDDLVDIDVRVYKHLLAQRRVTQPASAQA